MRWGIVLSGVIQTVHNCLRSNTVEQNRDEIQSNYISKVEDKSHKTKRPCHKIWQCNVYFPRQGSNLGVSGGEAPCLLVFGLMVRGDPGWPSPGGEWPWKIKVGICFCILVFVFCLLSVGIWCGQEGAWGDWPQYTKPIWRPAIASLYYLFCTSTLCTLRLFTFFVHLCEGQNQSL